MDRSETAITDEMIEAGVAAWFSAQGDTDGERLIAAYHAMRALDPLVASLEAALESVPIPGCNEPMPEFYERMNDWLNTTHRAALATTQKG